MKWLFAKINLIYRGALHFTKYFLFFIPRKDSLKIFFSNYYKNVPVTKQLRDKLHQPSTCIVCSSCDNICPLLQKNTEFDGPMQLVLGAMRGGNHLSHLQKNYQIMNNFDCLSCKKCENICPKDIEIVSITAAIVDNVKIHEKRV